MNNGVYNYIDDGLTYDAYVAAVPRLYNEVRFSFRPVTPDQRTYVYRRIERTTDHETENTIAAGTIAKQVKSWDLKKRDGKPVELKVDDIRKVQPRLFNRIFSIVMGTEGWDEDPSGKSDTPADLTELDTVLDGGKVQEQEKNS